MDSPFLDKEKLVENEFAYAFYDGFPVSKGHVLVVPKRVVPEIFDLTNEEYTGCFNLVKDVKEFLKKEFNPDGFNLGVNCGETAGQTVFHAHIHVIPRYKGDVPNPRGGIRHVIPGKGNY
tara:strand:+ start:89 stop:448 length:360 start_codon:yes stop_codon:yes gene_type:complete